MRNPTRTGTVYRSRNLTKHYVSGIGTMVVAAVFAAVVAVLLFPSILGWFQ